MGSNFSSTEQHGNPVLYTFGGITVEPYWLVIVQLIVIQFLQRLYSRYAFWKSDDKKNWFIALEIAVLGEKLAVDIRPKYSVLDFVLSLISVAHFIFACIRQTACSSDINYSAWKCYNAFGYRLYNYVLPSVISVLVQSSVQAYNTKAGEDESGAGKYFKMFLLGITFISNATICLVFVPYFITNALPMFVGFCWLLIPLMIILTLVYALFITITVGIISGCMIYKDKYCGRFFGTHCAVGLQVFGCLVLGMAYNYSQYCYFGGGYIAVLGYEFQSRDTTAWGRTFANSTDFRVHNILGFF